MAVQGEMLTYKQDYQDYFSKNYEYVFLEGGRQSSDDKANKIIS